MLQRDQFELLSAYLDGEVTAAERRQVEELLREDDKTKQLYARLLKLREGFQGMPLTASQPVEDTVDQVMRRLEQPRPRRRAWVLAGGAVAAAAVAAFSGLFDGSPSLRFATQGVEGVNTAVNPPVEVEAGRPEKENVVFREDELAVIAASPEAIAVMEPALSTDALMIAIDEPLFGSADAGDLSPVPSADQGVN